MTRVSSLVVSSENAARNILRRCKADGPPTSVELICKCLNIRLVKEDLDDELSGMAFVKRDLKYIIVNQNHHVNRRRFTIAHEIAHHVLHEDYLTRNVHVDTLVLNRDSSSADGVDRQEIEANAFAAELLMPMASMRPYLSIEIADDIATRGAAKSFGVSPSAFTYRLLNLGGRIQDKV